MNRILLFLILGLLLVYWNAQADVKKQQHFLSCTKSEKVDLEEYQRSVLAKINLLIVHVETYLQDHEELTSSSILSLKRARQVLLCTYRKLSRLNYDCSSANRRMCDEGTRAWINWSFGKQINICKTFWDDPPYERVSTLLHESTHNCGTLDGEEFGPHFPPRKKRFGISLEYNAWTYEYWNKFGFYWPGK